MIKIFYGDLDKSIDVTDICLKKLTKNNIITIPRGDFNRAYYFTDPLFGTQKKIIVKVNDNLTYYDQCIEIKINTINKKITTINPNDIYKKINIVDLYGNKVDIEHIEKHEQDLANEYILEDDVVLELGARYGSVSCIINSKLNNKNNQVVVEPDDRV